VSKLRRNSTILSVSLVNLTLPKQGTENRVETDIELKCIRKIIYAFFRGVSAPLSCLSVNPRVETAKLLISFR
jgi:hypothetical protein